MNPIINDGGTAFPSHGTMGEVAQEGMSLRDYFAAKAPSIPAVEFERKEWSTQVIKEHSPDSNGNTRSIVCEKFCEPFEEWVARWRYAYADAMLKAREVSNA